MGSGSTPWAISPMTSRLVLSPQCMPSTTRTTGCTSAIAASRLRRPASTFFLRAYASSSLPTSCRWSPARRAAGRRARRVAASRRAARARDERDHLVEGLLAGRADRAAHEIGHGRVRDLHRDGRALDVQEPRVRRHLGEERRDERGLADAHLADDRAADELPPPHAPPLTDSWKAACRSAFSASRPTEIARARLRLREPLLAREAALERVDAHRRRHLEVRLGVEPQGRRVAPAEVAADEAVHAARDPRAPQGRRALEHVGDVLGGIVQRVVHEVALRDRACRWRCRARCRWRPRRGAGRSSLKPAMASCTSSESCAASAAARDEFAPTPAMACARTSSVHIQRMPRLKARSSSMPRSWSSVLRGSASSASPCSRSMTTPRAAPRAGPRLDERPGGRRARRTPGRGDAVGPTPLERESGQAPRERHGRLGPGGLFGRLGGRRRRLALRPRG